jgi:hypothetical protein
LTKATRFIALVAVAATVLTSCARGGSSPGNARPIDFYAAVPSLADVRQVLGDNNWWPMPPSFGVPPLDSNRLPVTIKFEVTQTYLHVGTAEALVVSYIVLASSTIATLVMTNLLTASQATPITSPKVGDSTLYVQTMGTGAAPFDTTAYVRVGTTLTATEWFRRDAFTSANQMANIARKVTAHVKDVVAGKLHASPQPQIDSSQLPPPGFEITLLGYARVPTESVVLELGYSSAPEQIATLLHSGGVNDALYGDYVLNADTHMEVKTLLMNFADATIASQWLDAIRGSTPLDANGIFSVYSQTRGQYFYAFAAGSKTALLTCAPTGPTEAASRACEVPLQDGSFAWKLSLGG